MGRRLSLFILLLKSFPRLTERVKGTLGEGSGIKVNGKNHTVHSLGKHHLWQAGGHSGPLDKAQCCRVQWRKRGWHRAGKLFAYR